MNASDSNSVGIKKMVITLEKWRGDDHSVPPYEKIIKDENGGLIYHEIDGVIFFDRR